VELLPLIAANAQAKKRPTAINQRIVETHIKVRSRWTYLYRAVDRDGQTVDFASRTFASCYLSAMTLPQRSGHEGEQSAQMACRSNATVPPLPIG
jgi:hypothetical protein